jgi:hypothetical protein
MQRVAVDEAHVQSTGNEHTDRALACTRDTHHDNERMFRVHFSHAPILPDNAAHYAA